MDNPRPETRKLFYAVNSPTSPVELEKQRQAEIERMIEAKVAQALRHLQP